MTANIFVNNPKRIVKIKAPIRRIIRYTLSPSSFKFFSLSENMRRSEIINSDMATIKNKRT